MKFSEYKIGFTVNIFDDSDNILPIIQVRGDYVAQMHNTVRIVQLGVVKNDGRMLLLNYVNKNK